LVPTWHICNTGSNHDVTKMLREEIGCDYRLFTGTHGLPARLYWSKEGFNRILQEHFFPSHLCGQTFKWFSSSHLPAIHNSPTRISKRKDTAPLKFADQRNPGFDRRPCR
jgi:hypothetical protein